MVGKNRADSRLWMVEGMSMNELTTKTTPTPKTPLAGERGRPYTPGQGEAMRPPCQWDSKSGQKWDLKI